MAVTVGELCVANHVRWDLVKLAGELTDVAGDPLSVERFEVLRLQRHAWELGIADNAEWEL